MSYLPPVDWADVATKRNLEALGHRVEATLYRELGAQTRTLFLSLAGFTLTLSSIAFAASRLG